MSSGPSYAELTGSHADAPGVEVALEPGKPLLVHRQTVLPAWIDYNGHMNVAFYVLAFDTAVDAFLDYCGLTPAFRKQHNVSTYALEAHVTYRQEVVEGDELRFEIQLLDRDARFFHYINMMYREADDELCATAEWMSVSMDMARRKPAPFLPEVDAKLEAIWQAHKDMPRPPEAGRTMGIRRKG
jgi:acyl-CoA thioester hydrolase